MRLSPGDVDAIKRAAAEHFGPRSRIYLFGSRADDSRRGGDIDLFIEPEETDIDALLDAKVQFLVALKRAIGDQRIDVVVSLPGAPGSAAIEEIAKATGVRL